MMMDTDDMEDMMSGGSGMKSGMMSGGSGMKGSGKKEEPAILIELPNFQLNLIRRRMKIYAFSANDVLQNATGIEAAASAKDKQLRLAIKSFCDDFFVDSNIGLVDAGKADDEMEIQRESYTSQLQEACKDGASKLKTLLTRHAGGGDLGPAPGGKAKPPTELPF